MKNKKLAQEIFQMVKLDQKVRKSYERKKSPGFLREMKKVDGANLVKMKKIVKKFGWPTINLVGKRASYLAWLLIQHADSDVKFQEHCLKLMKKAVKNGVSKANIAYLTDRVLVNRGKPQIYGTQFYEDKSGKLAPRPIKNIKTVDKKRREMGLGLFKFSQRKMGGE